MPYEVLALKYRPKVFEDLIGQEAVTRTLTNAIQQNRIAHAFLFAGVRGVGKTTTARILSKALNCERGPTVRPCGECAACTEIARGSSLDVLEIDGASNNGVEQVRELIDGARYAPSRDRFKIYIIDEVHMLSTPAFNALLKTLEEPPPAVKFIFATTEHHKIPDTIVSRCQEYEFRTVAPALIFQQLSHIAREEGIEVSEPAIRAVARAASGSLRDGISALDQVIAASDKKIEERDVTELLGLIERDVLEKTTRALIASDTAEIMRTVDGLARGGRDFRFFASALMQYLRDVLVAKVAPDATELIELPGEMTALKELSQDFSEEDLLRALDVLTQAETALRVSPEPRFHLEMALLKLSQLRKLASFEELLARFEQGGGSGGAPPPSGAQARKNAAPRARTRAAEPEKSAPPRRRAKTPPPPPASPASPRAERTPPAQEFRDGGDWTSDVPPVGETKAKDSGPPPAQTAVNGDDIGQRLVETLRTKKPMLHALVSQHEQATLDNGRLTLTFRAESQALAEQLQEKRLNDQLTKQAEAVAGERLRVEVEILAAEAPSEPPPEESPPSPDTKANGSSKDEDALRELAGRDPLVRRFVDTFQGQIEGVEKPDR